MPDYIERMQTIFNKAQFMQYIGAELIRVEPGFCEIHVSVNLNNLF